MADIPISSLPVAPGLSGTEDVPIVQGGVTKRTTTGAISTVGIGAEFVLVSANPLLPNSRGLAGAPGQITLADGGAGENLTVGLGASGVSPGTYGDDTHTVQATVDDTGRITSISAVAIAHQGTVTSVGLTAPPQFNVSGSPVTGSGTLAATWKAQNANTVLAGPASGTAADPTFRALTDADLPGGTTGTGAVVLADSPALTGTPTAPTQTVGDNSTKLATTAYVQAAVSGTTTLPASKYATAAALPGVTYANGASGVGATLTATANGALTVDGDSPAVGDEILVKNQTATLQNGIYSVTATGSGSAPFVLTRATYYDQPAQVDLGDTTFVTSGSTLASTSWTQNGTENPVIGTDPITFAQTAGPGSFIPGNGISISGTSIAIDTSVTADLTSAQTLENKTLVTPDLGTPSAIDLANASGLESISSGAGVLPSANGGGPVCATRTVLADLDTTKNIAAWLAEDGRQGWFQWNPADLSVQVALDATQGIYVAPTSDPTGASGAWIRLYSGHPLGTWWGMKQDGVTDCNSAISSIFALGLQAIIPTTNPSSFYKITGTLSPTNNSGLLGDGGMPTLKLVSAITGTMFDMEGVTGAALKDLTIDGDQANTPSTTAILLNNCIGCNITKNALKNLSAGTFGCLVVQGESNDNDISNNTTDGCENTPISLTGAIVTQNNIQNNQFSGSLAGFGIRLGEGANNNYIANNKTTSNPIELIGVTFSCFGNRIIGNFASGCGDNGISLSGHNNICIGNRCFGNFAAGIWSWGNNNIIVGNTCFNNNNNGGSPTGQWAGIGASANFGGTGQNNMITGNNIGDNQQSPTQFNGVRIAGNAYTLWASGQNVTAGNTYRYYGLNIYVAASSGTTGTTPPTWTSGTMSDGAVDWTYLNSFIGVADSINNVVGPNVVTGFYSAAYADVSSTVPGWVLNTLIGSGTGLYFQGPIAARSGTGTGSLILGADVNAQTITNGVRKLGRIASNPYTSGQPGVFGISLDNDGTNNNIFVGGGTASLQAATLIEFLTASALDTPTGTLRLSIDKNGNIVVGSAAIPTTATDGFFYIDSCAGAPTGTPTSYSGRVPLVYDTTDNKLYLYNGGWKAVTLS